MIRAIETRYSGYKFRSRLEARWAVFLDTIGARWHYEHEGFSLPSGSYLPDFFIEYSPEFRREMPHIGIGIYMEVKPVDPSEQEARLLLELKAHTEMTAILVIGAPGHELVRYARPNGSVSPDELQFGRRTPAEFMLDLSCAFGCVHRIPGDDCFWTCNEAQAVAAAREARFDRVHS